MQPDPQWIHGARPRAAALKAVLEAGIGPELAVQQINRDQTYVVPSFNLLDGRGDLCAAQVVCPTTRCTISDFAERWEDFYTRRLGSDRTADRPLRRLLPEDLSFEFFGPPRGYYSWWQPAVLAIALASRRFGVPLEIDGTKVYLQVRHAGQVLEMSASRNSVWDSFRGMARRVRKPADDARVEALALPEQVTNNPMAWAWPKLKVGGQWALAALIRRVDLGLEPEFEAEELLQVDEVPKASPVGLMDVLCDPMPLEQLHAYLVPTYMTATAFHRVVGHAWAYPDRIVRNSTLQRLADHLGISDAI